MMHVELCELFNKHPLLHVNVEPNDADDEDDKDVVDEINEDIDEEDVVDVGADNNEHAAVDEPELVR